MRVLINSMLASKSIILKPEIELNSLGPTIELVRESDWATILPVVAVKRAGDRKLVRLQRIVDPEIPREVIVAAPTTRTPTLAAELFLKILKTNIATVLIAKRPYRPNFHDRARIVVSSPPPLARKPTTKALQGTTDTHFHIFESTETYPLSPTRMYDPALSTVDDYRAMAQTVGIDRMVVVQASIYGTDNRCLVDSIERLGVKNTRGIAVVDQSITLNALRDMDRRRRARNPVQRHHWPDAD